MYFPTQQMYLPDATDVFTRYNRTGWLGVKHLVTYLPRDLQTAKLPVIQLGTYFASFLDNGLHCSALWTGNASAINYIYRGKVQ